MSKNVIQYFNGNATSQAMICRIVAHLLWLAIEKFWVLNYEFWIKLPFLITINIFKSYTYFVNRLSTIQSLLFINSRFSFWTQLIIQNSKLIPVETVGVEPTTFCVQGRRSSQLS